MSVTMENEKYNYMVNKIKSLESKLKIAVSALNLYDYDLDQDHFKESSRSLFYEHHREAREALNKIKEAK